MKKIVVKLMLGIMSMLFVNEAFSQEISRLFFGQNAWMPDSIGKALYNGQLHKSWPAVKAGGSGIVRLGGTAVDQNMPSNHQYIEMIDSIRAGGMEPMVQVSFDNYKYTPAQAASVVKHVNIVMKRNVKYWVIGNEPDLAYGHTNSSQVAAYMKSFASAMKAADPTILIIGPETAWYNKSILFGLTNPGGPDDITGKDANGRYYIDYISFHTYPFKGTQQRPDVVSKLASPGEFEDNLTEINARIQNCNIKNGRSGASAVKLAVTEANIEYMNPAGDNLYGVGANSFIGGQFWSEMMGIAMKKGVSLFCFWSIIEGGGANTDIGYLNGRTGVKKPSYYHYQMMAQNFRGKYASSTDNLANIKTFASVDGNQVSVIILNQDEVSSLNYTVKLNTASVGGTSTLKINVDAGISKEHSDFIHNQSTILLVFDLQGNLLKRIEYKLDGHANASKAPDVQDYNTPTGINGAASSETLNVRMYPNPAKDHFTVEANTSSQIKMEMYNLAGQLIYSRKLEAENGTVKTRIDVDPNVATGLYVVQVKVGNKTVNNKMLLTK